MWRQRNRSSWPSDGRGARRELREIMLFRKRSAGPCVDMERLPQHIAIIMDGNGRWAKKRHVPRSAGHAAGAEALRRIATCARDLGIPYLTVYAFSTENWKRSRDEVDAIMKLLKDYLQETLRDMDKNQFHMAFFGDLTALDPELWALCDQVEERSKVYTRFQMNVCLNYGSRDEILHAARAYAADCLSGRADPQRLSEADFGGYLYTRGVPDPDLIIRPSGEQRLSNFLLWQAAYAEFYYTDICWPDFKKQDLLDAVATYQLRSRRFGGR